NQCTDEHIYRTQKLDFLSFILVLISLSTTFNQMCKMNLTSHDPLRIPPNHFDQKIEVIVDAYAHYSVNGQAKASKEAADLNTAIKQISNERRDLMFVIAADAKASHQDVIRVMDVAGQLGFVNVNISTKVPTRGY